MKKKWGGQGAKGASLRTSIFLLLPPARKPPVDNRALSNVFDKRASKCSITENIPPKGVSFSDFITTFAMPVKGYLGFFHNTKLSGLPDMAKF